jgi:serine/threonine protein kinase
LGCNTQTQEKCAVKVINKNDMTKEQIFQQVQEYEILKTLNHPHIIRLFDYWENDEIILIFEELCDTNLLEVISIVNHFSEEETLTIVK